MTSCSRTSDRPDRDPRRSSPAGQQHRWRGSAHQHHGVSRSPPARHQRTNTITVVDQATAPQAVRSPTPLRWQRHRHGLVTVTRDTTGTIDGNTNNNILIARTLATASRRWNRKRHDPGGWRQRHHRLERNLGQPLRHSIRDVAGRPRLRRRWGRWRYLRRERQRTGGPSGSSRPAKLRSRQVCLRTSGRTRRSSLPAPPSTLPGRNDHLHDQELEATSRRSASAPRRAIRSTAPPAEGTPCRSSVTSPPRAFALNTITIDGNAGDDTVDISAAHLGAPIVFRSNGGNDTIVGTLRPQDVIELEPGRTADEHEWEGERGRIDHDHLGRARPRYRVTFRCEGGRPNLGEVPLPTDPKFATRPSNSLSIPSSRRIRWIRRAARDPGAA